MSAQQFIACGSFLTFLLLNLSHSYEKAINYDQPVNGFSSASGVMIFGGTQKMLFLEIYEQMNKSLKDASARLC